MNNEFKDEVSSRFKQMQSEIVSALSTEEHKGHFQSDPWSRLEGGYGGGGLTRIVTAGEVFERGGVNFSEVHGELPADMSEKLIGENSAQPFYASGVSIVMHPYSPMVPTVHFNVRYLEVKDKRWFGGGTDLTPYYLFEEDAKHFHQTLKAHCDKYNPTYYSKFKKWCDEYFYLQHRNEARGVGGIFFDYLGKEDDQKVEAIFPFVAGLGKTFIDCYLPIVKRRRDEEWGEDEKQFQLMRRGRYVEFNLIYDRGTLFGLRTGGRTESILMSLPPEVKWVYDYKVNSNSREAKLFEILSRPREWL